MKPNGAVEREMPLKGKEPTNLAFGGSDGKTVFVTQRQGGFVESFRTARQGREHCLQRGLPEIASCDRRCECVLQEYAGSGIRIRFGNR